MSNSYYDGTAYKYIGSGAAARQYYNTDGTMNFYNASSGTAGGTVTWNERMRIGSSGHLLLGTTTVAYSGTLLHVGDTSDSQNGIQISTSTTGYGYILFGDGTGADAYRGQISYKHGDDYMSMHTAGGERMRIDSSGSVQLNSYGSGTKTGTAAYSLSVDSSGNIIETTSTSIGGTGTTNYVTKWLGANTIGDSVMYDDGTNVGIGVTSLQSWAKLQVAGTAGAQTGANQALYVTAPSTTAGEGVGIRLSAASGSNEAVGIIGMVNNASGNAGSMTFHTYNLGANIPERMRITNDGYVGIGTNSPWNTLDVRHGTNNRAVFSDSSSYGDNVLIGLDDAGGEIGFGIAGSSLSFYTNVTERMRIDSSGNTTFTGALIDLDSAASATVAIDRGATTDDAIVSWRNAGSEYFRAGLDNTDSNLWSLLHTCGTGLYFDGNAMAFGIGETNPGSYGKLVIKNDTSSGAGSSNASSIWLLNSDTTANNASSIFFGDNGPAAAGAINFINTDHTNEYGEISFDTRGSGGYGERMRIDSLGNVQVGTDTPLFLYSEQGVAQVAANRVSSNGTIIDTASSAAYINLYTPTAGSYITFHTANAINTSPSERFRIASNGDVYNYQSVNKANTYYGYLAGNYGGTGTSNNAFGYDALRNVSTGNSNVAIGRSAGFAITTGVRNIAIGLDALRSYTTGQSAIGIGFNAGYSLVSATGQIAIGQDALYANSGGVTNTAVGYASLTNATGNYNTAFGYETGLHQTTSRSNVWVGLQAGYNNSTGSYNIAIGESAGFRFTTGSYNIGIGAEAGIVNNVTGSYNTSVGHQSGRAIGSGTRNSLFGSFAGIAITSGNYNTILGYNAGSTQTTASYVTAVGDYALANNTGSSNSALGQGASQFETSGEGNTALGAAALQYQVGGNYNVAIGFGASQNSSSYNKTGTVCIGRQAGFANTGDYNVSIGYQAGYNSGAGIYNVSVGFRALHTTTSGNYNNAVGSEALLNLSTGTHNNALGFAALKNVTVGSHNVGIGYDAFQALTSSSYNTGVGGSVGTFQTGNYNTSMGYFSSYGVSGSSSGDYNATFGYYAGAYNRGENNTFLGALAGRFNSTGTRNTIVGSQAADNSTITGSHNTALGFGAAHNIGSGVHNVSIGDSSFYNGNANFNIAIGSTSLYYTTGAANVAVGYLAGHANTSGHSNNYIGYQAGQDGTSCTDNNFMGYQAGENVTTGSANIGIGTAVFQSLTTSSGNVAFGYAALGGANMTGTGRNIAIGDAAGYNVSNGQNNILIGWNAGRTGSQSPQSMGGVASGSNQIHIGNESHTNALVQVSWTVNSDGRDKTDVKDLDLGLDFINSLRPVTYRWDKRSQYEDKKPTGEHKESKLEVGLIAQEVIEQENKAGYNFEDETNLFSWESEDKNKVGLQYEKLVPALINSIKELKQEIETLKSQINN